MLPHHDLAYTSPSEPSCCSCRSPTIHTQDFGLYDEDPQIETLTHMVFFDTVVHSKDFWFVNFYSPGMARGRL